VVKGNTHLYIADQAMQRSGVHVLKQFPKEYLLGSVAPDTFLYSTKFKDLSYFMHGKNGEKTNTIIFELLDGADNEADLAYALGYITHCAADIVWHPFIFYLAGNYNDPVKLPDARYRHYLIETTLDKMFNPTFRVNNVLTKDLYEGLNCHLVFSRHYPTATTENLSMLLKRQITLNKDYSSPNWYMVAKALSVFGKRYIRGFFYGELDFPLNEENSYKDLVTGEPKKATLHGLMEDSIVMSVKMIDAANKYMTGQLTRAQAEKIIDGRSLFTGKIGVPLSAAKFFVQYSSSQQNSAHSIHSV